MQERDINLPRLHTHSLYWEERVIVIGLPRTDMIQVSSLRGGLAVAKYLTVQKLPLKLNATCSVQLLCGCVRAMNPNPFPSASKSCSV